MKEGIDELIESAIDFLITKESKEFITINMIAEIIGFQPSCCKKYVSQEQFDKINNFNIQYFATNSHIKYKHALEIINVCEKSDKEGIPDDQYFMCEHTYQNLLPIINKITQNKKV